MVQSVLNDGNSIPLAEASAGRCHLCHRRLVAHAQARTGAIERLGEEWGGVLVHRSCAVLGGLIRPATTWEDRSASVAQ